MSFHDVWKNYLMSNFFHNCKKTPSKIRELYEKAKRQPSSKALYKIEDPGQFSIPCTINGRYFDGSICGSRLCINLMPTTEKLLGITRLQRTQISIGLADSLAQPRGVVLDVLLEIRDTKIPMNFHIMNVKGRGDIPLILGRSFLATTGAIMDWPNRRIYLAKIDKTIIYPAILPFSASKQSRYCQLKDS